MPKNRRAPRKAKRPPESVTELLSTLSGMRSGAPSFLLSLAKQQTIKLRHESADKKHGRVLLALERDMPPKNELMSQCNGLVIDMDSWSVLALPPPVMTFKVPRHVIDAMLASRAPVYRINDGTIVTLYSYNGRWCIATNRGYDVSSLRWRGARTYAEVLFSVLSQYPAIAADLSLTDGRLRFKTLDPSCSYTIGFRHHDFHPLRCDPQRAWLISTARGATLVEIPLFDIPRQRPVELKERTFEYLRASCANAIDTALDIAKGASGQLHYGYFIAGLLNGTSPVRVRIDSPLLASVRNLFYHRLTDSLDAAHRARATELRAFLDPALRPVYVGLMQCHARFSRYAEFFEAVIAECARVTEGTVAAISGRASAIDAKKPAYADRARAFDDGIPLRIKCPDVDGATPVVASAVSAAASMPTRAGEPVVTWREGVVSAVAITVRKLMHDSRANSVEPSVVRDYVYNPDMLIAYTAFIDWQ